MCGIVAIINPNKAITSNFLQSATDALAHRGPDAQKWKHYNNGKIGLGHTRLSLVDLSANADQPLEIDNYAIIFNGEIYNYEELRNDLQANGQLFKTTSDTEVIIHAIKHWGIDQALKKFNGCFAFIIYNTVLDELIIARDQLGEKQLVYTQTNEGEWIFASEIKAILKHPSIKREPNIDQFIQELIFNMYADPLQTFFKNIYHFPPGYYFKFEKNAIIPQKIQYWNLATHMLNAYSHDTLQESIQKCHELLNDSVRLRMHADTEIGSILSGGLDSSLVTAIACLNPNKAPQLKAYTIYYNQKKNIDLVYARLLASQNKNIHLQEVPVKKEISQEEIEKLTYILEEPLIDKTNVALNTLYQHVHADGLKAVLNGQGSDELWLGYIFADEIFTLSPTIYTKQQFGKYWFESSYFSDFVTSKSQSKKFQETIENNLNDNFFQLNSQNKFESLIYFSLKTHLSKIFKSEDRFSMANSIEVRLPHIDIRLIELALSISPGNKMYDKREKYILRQVAKNILPAQIIKRKKRGFPIPPRTYDSEYKKNVTKKSLPTNTIVSEIFQTTSVTKIKNELPLRERWLLDAIDCMEKIYFT